MKTKLKSTPSYSRRTKIIAVIFALVGIIILFIAATNPTRFTPFAKRGGGSGGLKK